jgi:hypothetical protein
VLYHVLTPLMIRAALAIFASPAWGHRRGSSRWTIRRKSSPEWRARAWASAELEEERGKAEKVKQEAPILIILGNPPYNGFAGMAVTEERAHSTAYRTTTGARRPKARG